MGGRNITTNVDMVASMYQDCLKVIVDPAENDYLMPTPRMADRTTSSHHSVGGLGYSDSWWLKN
jgi:hypothetical protein